MIRCHTRFKHTGRLLFCTALVVGAFLFPLLSVAQTVSFDFRAINLISAFNGIDVHFNNLEQASVSNVEFGYTSQVLQSLPAIQGTFNVKLARTGQGVGNAFAGSDVTAQGNREYSAVAYGTAGLPKMKVLERNRAQLPATDFILVRVFNAMDEATPIDVHLGTVGNSPLFSNVLQDQATQFLNVPAEATALIITEAGKTVPLVQLTAPFGAGTPYLTLIVTGTNRSNLQVYALSDFESQKTQLVLLQQASYANLRVVHLRPNSGQLNGDSLDIYFNKVTQNDTKITDTLKYRYASRDFGPVFADNFKVKFVPAGESPGTSVLSLERQLGNDTSYVVVLTEFQDLKPTSLVLTRSPVEPVLPGLSSRIRFANASAFYGPITLVLHYNGDSIVFENVDFKSATEFREIPTGILKDIKAYHNGSAEPFFTGSSQNVPPSTFITLIAFGNEQDFLVDALNESQSGRQRLAAFGPTGAVASREEMKRVPLSGVPNPVSSQARLLFSLERPGQVQVSIYDVMGRNVIALPSQLVEAGAADIALNLEALSPGVYTCLLRSDDGSVGSTKIVVTR